MLIQYGGGCSRSGREQPPQRNLDRAHRGGIGRLGPHADTQRSAPRFWSIRGNRIAAWLVRDSGPDWPMPRVLSPATRETRTCGAPSSASSGPGRRSGRSRWGSGSSPTATVVRQLSGWWASSGWPRPRSWRRSCRRWPIGAGRERVLILVSVLRGAVTAAVALVVGLGGPSQIVYALAVLSTIAATLYRPAHSALLPSLCHTGYELASANVVRGLLDAAATMLGPLLAALLLQFTGVTVVFAVAVGCLVVGRSPAVAAGLRRTAAAGCPEGVRPDEVGGRRNPSRLPEPRHCPHHGPCRGAVVHPWGPDRADGGGRHRAAGDRRTGRGHPHRRHRGGCTPRFTRGVVAGRHPAPRRVVRGRGGAVGSAGHADRRLPTTGRGAGPVGLCRRRELTDRSRGFHAAGPAGRGRRAGASLRSAGERGRPVRRGRERSSPPWWSTRPAYVLRS